MEDGARKRREDGSRRRPGSGEEDRKGSEGCKRHRGEKRNDLKDERRHKESSKGIKRSESLEGRVRLQRVEFDEPSCSVTIEGRCTAEEIRDAFKNAESMRGEDGKFVLKYPSKEHALVDMRANKRPAGKRREKGGEYMDNKYILTNLSYKETEESISKEFGKYGKVERVAIQKNRDNVSTGKAVITFEKRAVIRNDVVMSNKPIYIERIKKPLENKKRFFLGKMNKSHSIVAIRKILADAGCKPKEMRVLYGENKRNRGYGFIEYGSEADADKFVGSFEGIKDLLGPGCFYEYSNEKAVSKRR